MKHLWWRLGDRSFGNTLLTELCTTSDDASVLGQGPPPQDDVSRSVMTALMDFLVEHYYICYQHNGKQTTSALNMRVTSITPLLISLGERYIIDPCLMRFGTSIALNEDVVTRIRTALKQSTVYDIRTLVQRLHEKPFPFRLGSL